MEILGQQLVQLVELSMVHLQFQLAQLVAQHSHLQITALQLLVVVVVSLLKLDGA